MALHLQGADRYNPERLSDLSHHVNLQVTNGTYDLETCLALLRLYNFDPDTVNVGLLAAILLKAMTQLPEPDFHLLLHLIPERCQDEPMIAAVISLNRQLEGAKFAQFWAEVDQLRDLVNPVVGFYDAVRDFIVYLIESTFQKVSTATLAQSVRLEGASLNSLIQSKVSSNGWQVGQDGTIAFASSRTKKVVPQGVSTEFRFEQLAPLLSIGA